MAMIRDGKVHFIDFQGGRRGPLGYDLASLLIDPYTSLPAEVRQELYDHYLSCLNKQVAVDGDSFTRGYRALALQRNLQIIGAFSFLSRECGKISFANYLRPALTPLNTMLACSDFSDLPVLRQVAKEGLVLLPGEL